MVDIGYAKRTLPFAAVVTALLTILLAASGTELGPIPIAALAAGTLVTLAVGDVFIASTIPHESAPGTSAAFVVGFVVLSLGTLMVTCCTTLSAAGGFCLAALPVLLFWALRREKFRGNTRWFSEAAWAGITAIILLWACRHQITSVPTLEKTSIFHPWSDYFIHGAAIAEFGDRLGVNQGDLMAAGQPLPFYHYGMFMYPAAILGLPEIGSGLSLATSVMLVLGLFIAVMGCWALANELGGPIAAILCSAALMMAPDAASFGAHHGYFGFRWLLITVPGSGYALGIASAGLLFLVRWQRSRNTHDLLLALGLVLALLMFRAQVFAIEAPAVALMAAYTHWGKRRRWILLATFAGILTAILFTLLGPLGLFAHHYQALASWIDSVYQEPSTIAPIYRYGAATLGRAFALWVGLAGLPYLMLGPWLILYPVCTWILWKRKALQIHDWFVFFLAASYGVVILLSSTPSNGDISEFKHRPFVWIYAVLFIWPLSRIIGQRLPMRSSRSIGLTLATAGCACAALMLTNPDFDPQATPLSWAKQHCEIALPPGLFATARFAKAHSVAGDRMIYLDASGESGPAMASLSGIPQYLTQSGVQWSREKVPDPWAAERIGVLSSLHSVQGDAATDTLLARAGVRWLVVDVSRPIDIILTFHAAPLGLHERPR